MTYYLDSSVIIPILNGLDPEVKDKMFSMTVSEIKIPSMVKAELIAGVYKAHDVKKTMNITTGFIDSFEITPFDSNASVTYGKIRAELENKGNRIGSNDLIIAATVLSRGGILVTKNTKEFRRVEGLHVENWSE